MEIPTNYRLLTSGFVYYEADCYGFLMNPYIPIDTEEDSFALMFKQNPLVGDERKVREELGKQAGEVGHKWLTGKKITREDLKVIDRQYVCECDDIKRERKRVGGDWVVAGCLTTRYDREQVRKNLGPDLLMIIINVDQKTVGPRLKKRHVNNPEHENLDMEAVEDAEYLEKYKSVVEGKFFWERNIEEIRFKGTESRDEVMEKVHEVIENHFKKKEEGGVVSKCQCVLQ